MRTGRVIRPNLMHWAQVGHLCNLLQAAVPPMRAYPHSEIMSGIPLKRNPLVDRGTNRVSSRRTISCCAWWSLPCRWTKAKVGLLRQGPSFALPTTLCTHRAGRSGARTGLLSRVELLHLAPVKLSFASSAVTIPVLKSRG